MGQKKQKKQTWKQLWKLDKLKKWTNGKLKKWKNRTKMEQWNKWYCKVP